MPISVSSQLICHFGDKTYFVGGKINDNSFSNKMYMIDDDDYDDNKWTLMNITLPGNGTQFSSNYICHNHKIYMFGPGGKNGFGNGQVWIFDVKTNELNTNILFPSDKDSVSLPCAAYDDEHRLIYIVGGITSDNNISDQTLVFDMKHEKFIENENEDINSMPYGLYGAMCNIINSTDINNKTNISAVLMVFGGIKESSISSSILEYNITSNKWSEIQNASLIPENSRSRTNSIFYEDDNVVFIIGGGSSQDEAYLNSSDIFYINNYSVHKAYGELNNFGVELNTVSMKDNKIYVWGGYGMNYNKTKKNLEIISIYDLKPDDDKNTTAITIILIGSVCFVVFLCGGSAYCLCARNQEKDDNAKKYLVQK